MEWAEDVVINELQQEAIANLLKFIGEPSPKGTTLLMKKLNLLLKVDQLPSIGSAI